jgi:hypothetical protein
MPGRRVAPVGIVLGLVVGSAIDLVSGGHQNDARRRF